MEGESETSTIVFTRLTFSFSLQKKNLLVLFEKVTETTKPSLVISWLGGPFVFLYFGLFFLSCCFVVVVKCWEKRERKENDDNFISFRFMFACCVCVWCFTANALATDRDKEVQDIEMKIKCTVKVESSVQQSTLDRHSTQQLKNKYPPPPPPPPSLLDQKVFPSSLNKTCNILSGYSGFHLTAN